MSLASLRQRMATTREAASVKVDELRHRSRAVDLGVAVVSRERLIAGSVLSAFIAFRLFIFLIPYLYVAVAGLGFYTASRPGGTADVARQVGLAGVVATDIATALETSDQGRWVALIAGSAALLWASVGVARSVHAVHLIAWRLPRSRMRTGVLALVGPIVLVTAFLATTALAGAVRERNADSAVAVTLGTFVLYGGLLLCAFITLPRAPGSPWTALLPGAVLAAVGLQVVHVVVVYYFVGRVGRASAVYGALGVALVVLAWLFLVGRLMVGSAELNAALWEQRRSDARSGDSRVRVDPDGRLSLPTALRSSLGLHAGDQFDVESDARSVRLVPVDDDARAMDTGSPPAQDSRRDR